MHCLYLYDSKVKYGMPSTSLTVELINDNKLVRDLLFSFVHATDVSLGKLARRRSLDIANPGTSFMRTH